MNTCMEKGVRLENVTGMRYMYHDPCHSPMKKYDPLTVVNTLMNSAQNGADRARTIAAAANPARWPSRGRIFRPRCASARNRKCASAWMKSAPAVIAAR